MPILRRWDNSEKTIVISEYVGHWTWQEVAAMRAEAKKEYDLLPPDHRVHIIHDWSQSSGFPADTLSQARKLMDDLHPAMGMHVFVGISPLFISLYQVFRRFYNPNPHIKFLFAHSIEDARDIIQQASRSQPASTQI